MPQEGVVIKTVKEVLPECLFLISFVWLQHHPPWHTSPVTLLKQPSSQAITLTSFHLSRPLSVAEFALLFFAFFSNWLMCLFSVIVFVMADCILFMERSIVFGDALWSLLRCLTPMAPQEFMELIV